jgi:RNA polymerase sigma-54 factor
MMQNRQYLGQRQAMQQRLSPQQIQYIKLLQLPTLAVEMRIKDELEQNPLLEDSGDSFDEVNRLESGDSMSDQTESSSDAEKSDESSEIDWDSVLHNTDYEGRTYHQGSDDWVDIPKPYYENLLENLERQVSLLDLTEKEAAIAEQIVGSIEEDGYLRRDLRAIVDSVIFSTGHSVQEFEADVVLKKIQRLDPPGIAARTLHECLLIQLEQLPSTEPGRESALMILRLEWDAFEKKHFDKIQRKLGISSDEMREAYDCIQNLDPKPGGSSDDDTPHHYVIPDFTVLYQPEETEAEHEKNGDFIISLHRKNMPKLRISRAYKHMWDELNRKHSSSDNDRETKDFIKSKMEAAKTFMDAIQQRSNTLLNVMRTIVALQETFFRHGTTLRPMILKDVADRIGMDISTISRVVNGKYVQTEFGVFELKYFFNEGIETEDGETASNRDVKNIIAELVQKEPSDRPLSDDAIAAELQKTGFRVARRTVSKYREQLGIPVARLRKSL